MQARVLCVCARDGGVGEESKASACFDSPSRTRLHQTLATGSLKILLPKVYPANFFGRCFSGQPRLLSSLYSIPRASNCFCRDGQ